MGYSKETPNYHLPQYVADDRPSYLGDWNETMGIIDTSMKGNSNAIANQETALANMKTYVDNTVSNVEASISKVETSVETSISNVETSISNVEARMDGIEAAKPIFAIPKNGKMVCIGDSWLEGHTPTGNVTSWGTRLANFTGLEGHNFYQGGAGFYATGGGKTFNTLINEAAVDNADADLVVIGGGINDRNSDPDAVKSAAATLIANARSKFPNAVIWVFPMMLSNRYLGHSSLSVNKAICNAISECHASNVCFNSGAWSWLYDDDSKCADSLHPNQAGHDTVAENMAICMGGGNPYVEYAVFATSTANVSGLFTRCGTTINMYLVNTTAVKDGGTIASFPIKYSAGSYFGVYTDAGDGGKIKTFKSNTNGNTFNISPSYGNSSQFYSNFSYAVNDNG